MSSKRVITNLVLEVEATMEDRVENPEEILKERVLDSIGDSAGFGINSCDLLPDIFTSDLKLKHLKYALSTYGAIRIKLLDTMESFSPSLGGVAEYYEYYVVDIEADNDVLVISIKGEI